MKSIAFIPVLAIFLFSCQPEKTKSGSLETEKQKVSSVKTVDATEFKNLSEKGNTIILDVRTPQEVAEGKIPNAIVINIYDPEFETKAAQLPKDQSILIYCSAGVRSAKASEFLIANGFTSVYHLKGGLGDWYQNNFPLEK
jgi:rhodanese-related sulfurtransferase